MARSKLSVFVSVFSLLVAAASIVTLFSVQKARSIGNARLSASSYVLDDPAVCEAAIPIDPEKVTYRPTAKIAVDFQKVSGLAVDAEDRIYVAGDAALCRYSREGKFEKRIRLSYPPTCLTVAGRQHMVPGRIYVGFADHVEIFEPDGTPAGVLGQGLENARFSSISTSEHYIFIADAAENVVQRFDWTGKLLEPFGESRPGHFTAAVNGVNAPFDLGVGLDDLVYVVNRRDHRAEGYSFEGRLENHWGQGSPMLDGFSGGTVLLISWLRRTTAS